MSIPRLLIAGTQSGVGKTTVSLALMAAFRARGRRVQPFKAGPDFIDPSHHKMACGRVSRNLDGWMLGADLNRKIVHDAVQDADIAIIEGMMGLFDGASAVSEHGSTAEIAKQVNAPVLLVVDGSAMARSAAALVSGYVQFDPDLEIVGVLFNRVRSEKHFHLLQEAVESAIGMPAVGYLRPNDDVAISDRHLGLRTAIENDEVTLYAELGRMAQETVDMDLVEELARKCVGQVGPWAFSPEAPLDAAHEPVKIGVAYDPAFCFYYQDNLELLQAAGGEIVWFSPLRDTVSPDVDMLYLGGGYPELYAEDLEKNNGMRHSIQAFAGRGGVVFAECGGLMYLAQGIKDFEGRVFEMVGVFSGIASMDRQTMTLGYREVQLTRSCILGEAGTTVRGHEFHYSTYDACDAVECACQVTDAGSEARGQDGLVRNNVLALYTHVHFASQPSVPRSLVQAARARKPLAH